jgi:MFS family permease
MAASFQPLTAVSETLGRIPVMAVSLFASVSLALLVAVSPNFTVLLVQRALQGFALAGIPAVAMSYLVEELHVTTGGLFAAHSVASGWVSARSATLGVQGAAVYTLWYYLGGSVGGTLGGLVFSVAHWSGVTAYTGAFLLTVLIITILLRKRWAATNVGTRCWGP